MKHNYQKLNQKPFMLVLSLLICAIHASGQTGVSASNASDNLYFVLGEGILGGTATIIVQADTSQTGISLVNFSSSVKVYPNPVAEHLKIISQNQAKAYSLVSVSGQVLLKRNEAFTEAELDLTSFMPGSYVLQIQFPNHTETYTIIKK